MPADIDKHQLVQDIQSWASALGFSQIGVAGVDLSDAEADLLEWLAQGFHGEMHYMARHGVLRARPAELVPGTVSIVTARMNYLPSGTPGNWASSELQRLQAPEQAIVSVYARGRDYHKVLRARLQKLAERIQQAVGPLGHRVFTDSAPVLEAELAARSGLGWRGKHTLVLSRDAGSMFFLGEIFLDIDLPHTPPTSAHCGACSACIKACPTGAIVAPGRVDARLCVSYLTIEHPGPIDPALREKIGNRVYGCDDCQLVCPWNKFAKPSQLVDFTARAALAQGNLLQLLNWTQEEFLRYTEGSPIRRIGYLRWQRNLTVVCGNALRSARLPQATIAAICETLQRWQAAPDAPPWLREHCQWALAQQPGHAAAQPTAGSSPPNASSSCGMSCDSSPVASATLPSK
ncbi:tRNA epoxyqueuosine(34) reductase QueG [Lampropedia cohaerens]|uniref:tRNA epoxyqueuosine(34) reductase QueG n=1 Tax=Lampropedia cohaerens TaxID=1610491 RepID=UPI0018D20876|nr:tRNA epoxyqueuosine(34) reductase QueG [Lampropedia cohaerens]